MAGNPSGKVLKSSLYLTRIRFYELRVIQVLVLCKTVFSRNCYLILFFFVFHHSNFFFFVIRLIIILIRILNFIYQYPKLNLIFVYFVLQLCAHTYTVSLNSQVPTRISSPFSYYVKWKIDQLFAIHTNGCIHISLGRLYFPYFVISWHKLLLT